MRYFISLPQICCFRSTGSWTKRTRLRAARTRSWSRRSRIRATWRASRTAPASPRRPPAARAAIAAWSRSSKASTAHPLSVGRKRRTIPGSMKRALLQRDRTCRFPGAGCGDRLYLEGHGCAALGHLRLPSSRPIADCSSSRPPPASGRDRVVLGKVPLQREGQARPRLGPHRGAHRTQRCAKRAASK